MDNSKLSNPLEHLQEIKSVLQRSSRIFSLSGWSGVWAGGVATIGVIYTNHFLSIDNPQWSPKSPFTFTQEQSLHLMMTTIVVFLVAVLGAVFFTYIKNKKKENSDAIHTIAQKIIINLSIPILCGAAFCFQFAQHGMTDYIIPSSLVFYGLALVNTSKYTFNDIKYLGLIEIIIGLIALYVHQWHLIFWLIGFGLLHIVYGVVMWLKYR